jgi:hypothetical protein
MPCNHPPARPGPDRADHGRAVAGLGLGRLRPAVRHGVVITGLGGRSLNVLAIGPGVSTPSAGPTVMADWIVGFSRMRKGFDQEAEHVARGSYQQSQAAIAGDEPTSTSSSGASRPRHSMKAVRRR